MSENTEEDKSTATQRVEEIKQPIPVKKIFEKREEKCDISKISKFYDEFRFPFVLKFGLFLTQSIRAFHDYINTNKPINILLIHEHDNEYDPNTVKAYYEGFMDEFTSLYIEKIPVGYLHRAVSKHV